jgi:transposase-like protein
VREFDPIKLASDGKKSRVYFRHLRWSGKRTCPRCRYRLLYYLVDYRFGCKRCRYKFGEFTGTYVGEFNFSLDLLVYLTYLFALGLPAYRIRFYVPVSLTKIEKTFRIPCSHTKKGSLYYTDDHTAYAALNLIGKHQMILHGKDEYVSDDAIHINGIERFWSYAKTWLYIYRGVPKQYFNLYLKEIEFKFNHLCSN